jgi:intracellular sulfur oxidation DsrE/DsrF family protein
MGTIKMHQIAKKLFFVFAFFALTSTFLTAKMDFSDPQPDYENPRKMIVQIASNDDEEIHHILGSINNILKEYPTGTLEVVVVGYYHGLKILRKDADAYILKRVKSLMAYDVEFIACKNTMRSKNWKQSDMIDNIDYVQAGLAEVMERVVDGWINIKP